MEGIALTFDQVVLLAVTLLVISMILFMFLPMPKNTEEAKADAEAFRDELRQELRLLSKLLENDYHLGEASWNRHFRSQAERVRRLLGVASNLTLSSLPNSGKDTS